MLTLGSWILIFTTMHQNKLVQMVNVLYLCMYALVLKPLFILSMMTATNELQRRGGFSTLIAISHSVHKNFKTGKEIIVHLCASTSIQFHINKQRLNNWNSTNKCHSYGLVNSRSNAISATHNSNKLYQKCSQKHP